MNRVWRVIGIGLVAAAGCKPDYPKCEGDGDCKAGEFCVNGLCQQCRDDNDCKAGTKCAKGRCEAAAGACKSASDCPGGQGCKDGVCAPCDADAQCGEGGKCKSGACLAKGACQTDEDCPEGNECQNGACVAPPTAGVAVPGQGPCALEPVYFDFNESLLTADATAALVRNAECLKGPGAGRRVRLDGHCDPRGTEEYNMALGDRRARSALEHLLRLGVDGGPLRPVSRGKLDATGGDESGWSKDRRVELVWE